MGNSKDQEIVTSINALAPTPKMGHITSSVVIPGPYLKHQYAGFIWYW